jgi:hypothetical protein
MAFPSCQKNASLLTVTKAQPFSLLNGEMNQNVKDVFLACIQTMELHLTPHLPFEDHRIVRVPLTHFKSLYRYQAIKSSSTKDQRSKALELLITLVW